MPVCIWFASSVQAAKGCWVAYAVNLVCMTEHKAFKVYIDCMVVFSSICFCGRLRLCSSVTFLHVSHVMAVSAMSVRLLQKSRDIQRLTLRQARCNCTHAAKPIKPCVSCSVLVGKCDECISAYAWHLGYIHGVIYAAVPCNTWQSSHSLIRKLHPMQLAHALLLASCLNAQRVCS